MPAIGDSDAVRSEERVLPQHVAALTLLQERVSTPDVAQVRWLDLACGRGQILLGLDDILSEDARQKIEYLGYDVDQRFARETTRQAGQLGLGAVAVKVGDMEDFDRILPLGHVYDFMTITNVIHELSPFRLGGLLASAITRLDDHGILFVYDMERLKPPELGALPWSGIDIGRITRRLLEALGAASYRPEVSRWHHRTVDGWSVQIRRGQLGVSEEEIKDRTADAVQAAEDEIDLVLSERLLECSELLEVFAQSGAETAEEQDDRERLLYDYWTLSQTQRPAR